MALKPVKLDNATRKELSKKLDPKLIKTRDQFGGKGKLSYISANTCIDLLNKAFGHNWSMRIVERWMEEGVPSPFTAKNGKEPVPQPPTAWCIVELSVNLKDEDGKMHTVTKSAFGSQSITGNQSVQSQNGYKGAQSDALKKAATLPGLGNLAEKMKKHLGSTDYKNASPIMREILVKHVNTDLTEDAKKIKCPTFIIWGTNDEAVPVEDAYELEKLIKDSGLSIYEGCTHYAYLERLGQTNAIIKTFIK